MEDTPIGSGTKRDWHKWFAWYPIVVNGKRVWLKNIYRRQHIHTTRKLVTVNEYAEFFDLLKKNSENIEDATKLAPTHPVPGQIWHHAGFNRMYMYDGSAWKVIK